VDDDYIYIDDKYGSGDGSFVDVVASFDTGETATISPVLEMTATQSPLVASWDVLEVHTDGKYHIPGNFYVRVSPSRTTESSATYNQKAVLVRFFWNYGASTTATRFFSLPGDTGQVLARTYKYGSLDSAYDRTLVAQFALPQHVPNPVSDTSSTDYGDSLKLFLRIHPALTAVISAEDTVVIGDTVHFADLGQNGGGVESRFWSFGDGDTVTATAPSHVYTSSGTKTAVLTKTHTYHGLQFLDTATVIVGTPLVPGPSSVRTTVGPRTTRSRKRAIASGKSSRAGGLARTPMYGRSASASGPRSPVRLRRSSTSPTSAAMTSTCERSSPRDHSPTPRRCSA
jgi:hypothetical protein